MKKTDLGPVIVGVIIGALFGWLILYAIAMLFGVTLYAIGCVIGYLFPVLIVALAVYLVVRHFRNRKEHNEFLEWKRNRR